MNSVHTDTKFCARPSTVAKAIFEKGGTDFQNKLVQKTSGRMEYGNIAVTEAGGNLRCKAVYHVCFDKTPTSQEEVICTHHDRNQSLYLSIRLSNITCPDYFLNFMWPDQPYTVCKECLRVKCM